MHFWCLVPVTLNLVQILQSLYNSFNIFNKTYIYVIMPFKNYILEKIINYLPYRNHHKPGREKTALSNSQSQLIQNLKREVGYCAIRNRPWCWMEPAIHTFRFWVNFVVNGKSINLRRPTCERGFYFVPNYALCILLLLLTFLIYSPTNSGTYAFSNKTRF